MRNAITEQNHKKWSWTGSAKIVSLLANNPHSHSRALAALLLPNFLHLSLTLEKPVQLRDVLSAEYVLALVVIHFLPTDCRWYSFLVW